ncbi:uncharacterized protein PV07_08771 [Cladophialophora immunda]|uniref:Protein kinase domain-containing protein n=1 Tax=Cladophialophora immunda TaxID=569365 RepID=A0A0D2C569_9EURO|nr:uncharacterized protein PV07_08771 [Cladophialophora immunda]KIW25605.1 hypothetical protein PV07_08771 [Cladophialophora immunda]
MAYIHEHRIIIADIRLDNLLLDDTLAINFCDFGESTSMPLEWDLHNTGELGYLILADIGQFGAVIYRIITGCPRRDDLPSTEAVWLGLTIEDGWTLAFECSKELAAALDQVKPPEVSGQGGRLFREKILTTNL